MENMAEVACLTSAEGCNSDRPLGCGLIPRLPHATLAAADSKSDSGDVECSMVCEGAKGTYYHCTSRWERLIA